MKPDIEALRKKYMENPPEGMSSEDIRHMSEDELLDMDYFLNEDDIEYTIFYSKTVYSSCPRKAGIFQKAKNAGTARAIPVFIILPNIRILLRSRFPEPSCPEVYPDLRDRSLTDPCPLPQNPHTFQPQEILSYPLQRSRKRPR